MLQIATTIIRILITFLQETKIAASRCLIMLDYYFVFLEIVRAMTHVINQGMSMYWGTSRWSAMEIMVSDRKYLLHFISSTVR